MEQSGITNRTTANSLRGLCALLIVLTHLIFFVDAASPYAAFCNVGYLCVGVFFFYTGYNLFWGYFNKPESWKTAFWRKKLVRVWLPFAASNLLYLLILVIFNDAAFSAGSFFTGVLGLRQANSFLWYIFSVFCFYAVAWVLLQLLAPLKSHLPHAVFGTLCALLCFGAHVGAYRALTLWQQEATSLRYLVPLPLLLGMLWCVFEPQLCRLLRNRWVRGLAQLGFFFATCLMHYSLQHPAQRPFLQIPAVDAAFNLLTPLFAVLFLAAMAQEVQLQNSATAFLGNISAEMYIYHIPVLLLLRNDSVFIHNETLFVVLGLALLIGGSFLSHFITQRLAALRIFGGTQGAAAKQ